MPPKRNMPSIVALLYTGTFEKGNKGGNQEESICGQAGSRDDKRDARWRESSGGAEYKRRMGSVDGVGSGGETEGNK